MTMLGDEADATTLLDGHFEELEPEGDNSKAHSLKSVIPSMPSTVQRSCIKSANTDAPSKVQK